VAGAAPAHCIDAAFQWQADVFFLDDAGWGSECERTRKEDGFGIGLAEGGEAVEPLNDLEGEFGGCEFCVDLELGDEEFGG